MEEECETDWEFLLVSYIVNKKITVICFDFIVLLQGPSAQTAFSKAESDSLLKSPAAAVCRWQVDDVCLTSRGFFFPDTSFSFCVQVLKYLSLRILPQALF